MARVWSFISVIIHCILFCWWCSLFASASLLSVLDYDLSWPELFSKLLSAIKCFVIVIKKKKASLELRGWRSTHKATPLAKKLLSLSNSWPSCGKGKESRLFALKQAPMHGSRDLNSSLVAHMRVMGITPTLLFTQYQVNWIIWWCQLIYLLAEQLFVVGTFS